MTAAPRPLQVAAAAQLRRVVVCPPTGRTTDRDGGSGCGSGGGGSSVVATPTADRCPLLGGFGEMPTPRRAARTAQAGAPQGPQASLTAAAVASPPPPPAAPRSHDGAARCRQRRRHRRRDGTPKVAVTPFAGFGAAAATGCTLRACGRSGSVRHPRTPPTAPAAPLTPLATPPVGASAGPVAAAEGGPPPPAARHRPPRGSTGVTSASAAPADDAPRLRPLRSRKLRRRQHQWDRRR